MAEISSQLPDIEWLKQQLGEKNPRIKKITHNQEIDSIIRYSQFNYHLLKPLSKTLIVEAVKRFPQLNLVIVDDAGRYSGHCLVFPIKKEIYQRLWNRSLNETELKATDLVNYKFKEMPIFLFYDVTADCDENTFYLAGSILNFFKNIGQQNYLVSSLSHRYDSYELNQQLGLQLIWEDKPKQDKLGTPYHARFHAGDFKSFLGS